MKTHPALAAALMLAAFASVQAPAQAQQTKMPMTPGAAPTTSAATPAASMPLVDGEVRKIDLEKGLVVLRHGDIPNLAMPAMTMGFEVAERKMLDGLKVGDKLRFQAEMLQGKAVVTALKPAP